MSQQTSRDSHHHPGPSKLDELAKQRFPLTPRPKPACRSLTDRTARVRQLAHLAEQRTTESLTHAAEAHNLAALIASDCGMPALARQMCWQQFDVIAEAGTFDADTAKLALQPLINLGRLLIRDGDGASAYQLLETLFEAVKARTTTTIDGRVVSFHTAIANPHDHREITRWLWTVLLADGTRALTRAGRWADALHHLRRHHGIGQRLLDGRQVAILAAGDHDHALRLLATTQTPTPWETAVAACLKVYWLSSADQDANEATTAMANRYLELAPGPDHTAFHARLGLCVADLAARTHTSTAQSIFQRVIEQAVDSSDAYIAHDVITHGRNNTYIEEPHRSILAERIESAGLHQGKLPEQMEGDLTVYLRRAGLAMKELLTNALPSQDGVTASTLTEMDHHSPSPSAMSLASGQKQASAAGSAATAAELDDRLHRVYRDDL